LIAPAISPQIGFKSSILSSLSTVREKTGGDGKSGCGATNVRIRDAARDVFGARNNDLLLWKAFGECALWMQEAWNIDQIKVYCSFALLVPPDEGDSFTALKFLFFVHKLFTGGLPPSRRAARD
jgi:hypothetical protein